jgi:DNA primase
MGFLQYGHRLEPELLKRAVELPFREPALDAVRLQIAAADVSRPGWAADAVTAVREPYRSLGAELLAGEFPARDDAHAVASATDLARRLVVRALEGEKRDLLGALQRVPPGSDEARELSRRLQLLESERRNLRAA